MQNSWIAQLLVTLFATFAGVLGAFGLARWWDAQKAKDMYIQQLIGCIYELTHFANSLKNAIGNISLLPLVHLGTTAMQSLLLNPNLHKFTKPELILIIDECYHGVEVLKRIQDRQPKDIDKDTLELLNRVLRGSKYAGNAVSTEIGRLGGKPVSIEEGQLIKGFKAAVEGSPADTSSANPPR